MFRVTDKRKMMRMDPITHKFDCPDPDLDDSDFEDVDEVTDTEIIWKKKMINNKTKALMDRMVMSDA